MVLEYIECSDFILGVRSGDIYFFFLSYEGGGEKAWMKCRRGERAMDDIQLADIDNKKKEKKLGRER